MVEHESVGLRLKSERVEVNLDGGEGNCVGLLGLVPNCSGLDGVGYL